MDAERVSERTGTTTKQASSNYRISLGLDTVAAAPKASCYLYGKQGGVGVSVVSGCGGNWDGPLRADQKVLLELAAIGLSKLGAALLLAKRSHRHPAKRCVIAADYQLPKQ